MATSKPNDLRWWRGRGLVGTVLCLIVLTAAVILFLYVIATGLKSAESISTPKTQPAVQNSIQILGLTGVAYEPGSADKMARLDALPGPEGRPSWACQYWWSLSESSKQGLAFVDAKVVPSCATKRYVSKAKAEHRRRPQSTYSNVTSYYDLGNPGSPEDYEGLHYGCSELRSWTKYSYVPPAQPKMSDDEWANLTNMENFDPSQMTAKQKRQLAQYNQASNTLNKYQEDVVEFFEGIYTLGGSFDKGCYPPGAIFGGNGTVTFYPNHPVTSLRETAAPVFYGPGGSNLIGVGHRYTIKPGDSPSSVASHYYDDWTQWSLIVAANNLDALTPNGEGDYTYDISKLKWAVGQVIFLPVNFESG